MKNTTNYRAIIIAGALVVLGIMLNTLTNQVQDIRCMQLSSLDGWVLLSEIIFAGVLFTLVMIDYQSDNIIKVLMLCMGVMLVEFALLGANIIEAVSLIAFLSIIYFRTSAFDNRYIKLSLGLVVGGLTGSLLEANLFARASSIGEIIFFAGLYGMIVIGGRNIIENIVLKNSYRRYSRR